MNFELWIFTIKQLATTMDAAKLIYDGLSDDEKEELYGDEYSDEEMDEDSEYDEDSEDDEDLDDDDADEREEEEEEQYFISKRDITALLYLNDKI